MPRIQLRLYLDPGQAEVQLGIRLQDQTYERMSGIIDTGAEISLLPNYLLDRVDYRPAETGKVIIDQAGIAGQSFEATEAYITIFLEDQLGARSAEFEVRVWFADTDEVLVGFDGVLDRAILHFDMQKRDGWIDIDP